MFSTVKAAGLSGCGWLLCLLLCSALGVAQNGAAAKLSDTGNLPDAPSASVPPPPQVTQIEQSRRSFTQSRWLVVPAEEPYHPLTPREKFHGFVQHAVSPYTLAGALYDASWAHVSGDPKAYGGGMEGWGKRLGAAVAGTESRSFFGSFLFPTLLHQDPRYFAMYKGPVLKRGVHAVSRVFITRNDDGTNGFNSSGMLGIAFTEALGMAWAPEGKRSAGTAFTRMLGAMQGGATYYLLREFTPDLWRVFKRHCPERLKQIEEKVPPQITGDAAK